MIRELPVSLIYSFGYLKMLKAWTNLIRDSKGFQFNKVLDVRYKCVAALACYIIAISTWGTGPTNCSLFVLHHFLLQCWRQKSFVWLDAEVNRPYLHLYQAAILVFRCSVNPGAVEDVWCGQWLKSDLSREHEPLAQLCRDIWAKERQNWELLDMLGNLILISIFQIYLARRALALHPAVAHTNSDLLPVRKSGQCEGSHSGRTEYLS